MKKRIRSIGLLILMLVVQSAFAQYPDVPKEDLQKANAILEAATRRSDSIWNNIAYPIVQKEAQSGRPYVPWAGSPDDFMQAKIPAFPGAEGGGAFTLGGRGGRVIIVSSLADDGPGSLRNACEQGGARIIVFKVSGIIRLKSPIMVRAPYITIAGQTAPGDGICVAGESFWIDTHDVIIRHMRFRRGDTNLARRDNAIGGKPYGNIIFDHVSASWGLDEIMTVYNHIYYDSISRRNEEKYSVNITIQNSIFSEALDTWNHGFGSTLGGRNCTYMRNLWACNTGRNPTVVWCDTFNFTNNVIYNWVTRTVDGGDSRTRYNIINNYFKPGPQTPKDAPAGHRILRPDAVRSKLPDKVFGRCYVNGNIMEGYPNITQDNWDGGVQIEDLPNAGKYLADIKWDKPFPMPHITILPSDKVFDYVLANAGATLPKRDPVDIRVIKQVRTGKVVYNHKYKEDGKPQFKNRRLPKDSYKQGIITDIAQVGGYPKYKSTKAPKDTDNDGMPDKWEIKYGLNPKDASDAVKDCNGDGYTNIEKYINGIDPTKKVDWSDPKNNHDTLEYDN
ncbi:thrombospondin type 3 repeat-containing protein [Parabacteroides sp. FAFU027]|uniref:thrombospondin type 3 repeat-containing protein n=1 Tax=Parabacteroides sp. FAFU027 TaxID=2922715 RepID=UPI001FB02F6F|nr:thrombospondin type 3 repeat-containing protein [Parabacteroides sp. FAFU027]